MGATITEDHISIETTTIVDEDEVHLTLWDNEDETMDLYIVEGDHEINAELSKSDLVGLLSFINSKIKVNV